METARTRPLRPEALPMGTEVGHWSVVAPLGAGGYGATYEVEDIHHPGVMLALKLALRSGDARAEREVVLLMDKAVHPNVVRIHGHGRWPDPVEGHTYHVMDLVRGLPMDVWAETRNPAFLRLAEVGAKMARALGELHARGVLHRDVKPENILIREPDEEPVLVDFGIGVYEGAAPLTPAPLPPGTPHLRSPEAMRFWLERNKHSGAPYEVGAADDLYALGVSLYRAATGHYPFKPEVLGNFLVVAIASQRAPVPRSVNRRMPRALSDVLLRMLAKDPKERYRDGAEVHDALMAAAAFGRRARWETSLFEWEEIPAAREGEAPGRHIRRPALPTRLETPPAPAVRLAEGDSPSRRRRGRTGAAAARESPRRSRDWPGKLLGVALGLGLAVAAVYGFRARLEVKPIRPVGHEMARAPESSQTGSAAAPLLSESTPAAVASRATSSEEETSVKTKQQKSPTPKSKKTLRGLCAGAVAATQLACAGAQIAKGPGPETCPAGAMEAMTQTLGNLFSRASNPFHEEGPGVRLETEGDPRWLSVSEGDISVLMSDYWGELPANTVLTGKMYFAQGRAFVRLTRAWTPQGTVFPICAELWEPTERGLELRPGSTRGEVQAFSTNVIARPVRRFD